MSEHWRHEHFIILWTQFCSCFGSWANISRMRFASVKGSYNFVTRLSGCVGLKGGAMVGLFFMYDVGKCVHQRNKRNTVGVGGRQNVSELGRVPENLGGVQMRPSRRASMSAEQISALRYHTDLTYRSEVPSRMGYLIPARVWSGSHADFGQCSHYWEDSSVLRCFIKVSQISRTCGGLCPAIPHRQLRRIC